MEITKGKKLLTVVTTNTAPHNNTRVDQYLIPDETMRIQSATRHFPGIVFKKEDDFPVATIHGDTRLVFPEGTFHRNLMGDWDPACGEIVHFSR